jgi:hypothetical protein
MRSISREQLKKSYGQLVRLIQARHEMGPEVERELFVKHTPVEGLCHQRCYYQIWTSPGKPDLYISYLMDHIITDVELRLIGRSVQQVTFYDSFQEYEANRIRGMSSVPASEQTGINYN